MLVKLSHPVANGYLDGAWTQLLERKEGTVKSVREDSLFLLPLKMLGWLPSFLLSVTHPVCVWMYLCVCVCVCVRICVTHTERVFKMCNLFYGRYP